MTRVKSFILNKKGFCIVKSDKSIYLYTPTEKLKDVTLPRVKEKLISEIGSLQDVGMVEDVLSFCNGWGNNDIFHSSTRG